MGRTRTVLAALTAAAVGGVLALTAVAPAQAAVVDPSWGTFTLSGTNRAYTGTVTMPGFPATTFASDSRQSTVVSGASTWQGASTPPGGEYGTSRGQTYLNQRPDQDQPNARAASRTTYTFAAATPVGTWSFVLGDIDADQATITATDPSGAALSPAALGFRSTYNSCRAAGIADGWSCTPDPDGTTGQDVPTWDPATGVLRGNTAAVDTAGATAWFTPTVPLGSLTITYQQRSGFPVYQTWFATQGSAALAGTATIDDVAYPGARVTVTATDGVTSTTTTDADGRYAFPELPRLDGYTVTIEPPTGATGTATVGGVSLVAQDGEADFAFTAPQGTSTIVGTVVDADDAPVAGVPVTVTPPGQDPVETTTNDAGTYVVSDLPPSTPVAVAVDGALPVTVQTGTAGTPPTQVDPITVAPTAIAVVSGDVLVNETEPVVGVQVELLAADGSVVASTTTGADGGYAFPAVPRGTYQVRVVDPPAGAAGPVTATADATGGDVTVPFRLTVAPELPPVTVEQVEQPGQVVDTDGQPVAGRTVVATPVDAATGSPVSTTTGSDGSFALDGLAPEAGYTITTDGATAVPVTTPASGSAPAITLVVVAAGTPTTPPTTPPSTPPVVDGGGTQPIGSGSTLPAAGALAYSGSQPVPALLGGGLLLLAGLAFLVARGVRARRHRDHLQD